MTHFLCSIPLFYSGLSQIHFPRPKWGWKKRSPEMRYPQLTITFNSLKGGISQDWSDPFPFSLLAAFRIHKSVRAEFNAPWFDCVFWRPLVVFPPLFFFRSDADFPPPFGLSLLKASPCYNGSFNFHLSLILKFMPPPFL